MTAIQILEDRLEKLSEAKKLISEVRNSYPQSCDEFVNLSNAISNLKETNDLLIAKAKKELQIINNKLLKKGITKMKYRIFW